MADEIINRSVVMICPDSSIAAANLALADLFGDDPEAQELSRDLYAIEDTEFSTIVAWGGHIFRDVEGSQAIQDLAEIGDLAGILVVSVGSNVVALEHFNAITQNLGYTLPPEQ